MICSWVAIVRASHEIIMLNDDFLCLSKNCSYYNFTIGYIMHLIIYEVFSDVDVPLKYFFLQRLTMADIELKH